ncbi:alpha-N-arabinofuranosidase [Pedobacter changchengzhani]|uniref:non-reducing end alpha-L-arabinofuranosidase n=1 Tax=Pedobacter changchengzhani TaxID=2529274 RepID=A0A4R5MIJ0_9SPHI|nr:alpha-L-arabinofuranosidase C-terminal domain-containing protein [Pedobacter changchengzhani]TDG35361.1 alpha-N-arabinofuranosidase [Pedobacter changchengzhani]
MKKFNLVLLLILVVGKLFAQTEATLELPSKSSDLVISRHIYGQFSEHLGRSIYGGFVVGDDVNVPKQNRIRLDVVDALKKIKIPNLRWPGGCFADEYHWRDAIGPLKDRLKMINTNWGNVTEDNSFGTHEFLDLCSMLNCEPYIAGNVGSGTVQEMSNWIEYLNLDGESSMTEMRKQNGRDKPWNVTFWGVGNESWGCGGDMTAQFYSDQYKRYAVYARDYPGAKLKKIATGPTDDDYNWTQTLMKNVGTKMWGLSLHHYSLPKGSWGDKGSATNFDEKLYFNTLKSGLFMDELITKHSAIMDKYDPKRNVALVVDEWGVWTNVEPGTNPGFLYQQNSMRDALLAASTLNIFNNHCERVKMANLAQTVNVLQALVLTDKEKMLLTPTYYVFDLYKVHQDAQYLPLKLTSPDYVFGTAKLPAINASASKDKNGVTHISLVNIDPLKKIIAKIDMGNANLKFQNGQILTSEKFTDINTFEKPYKIKNVVFKNVKISGTQLAVALPPLSVVMIELK